MKIANLKPKEYYNPRNWPTENLVTGATTWTEGPMRDDDQDDGSTTDERDTEEESEFDRELREEAEIHKQYT